MNPAPTVSRLVARYQLRRRADTDAFAAGIRLARQGAVTLELHSPDEVRGVVQDPAPFAVRIVVDGDQLVGTCPCEEPGRICRHQVAVAHAVWVQDRRRFGRLQ